MRLERRIKDYTACSSTHKVLSSQEDVPSSEVPVNDSPRLEVLHGVGDLAGVGVEGVQVEGGAVML